MLNSLTSVRGAGMAGRSIHSSIINRILDAAWRGVTYD